MGLFSGVAYNLRGLGLGLRTPRLLALGLARFAITAAIAVVAVAMVLARHDQILALAWSRPSSPWFAWLWHLVSWALALLLLAVAALVGFLLAQLLFSAWIMDLMSRITERLVTGRVAVSGISPWYLDFLRLVREETLRALVPVLSALLLLALGWLTPLGPVTTVLSALASAIFLAWDSTDLIPARRAVPFRERLALLCRHLGFHLGFGLWFLVPVVNLLFLSFAPVGATLYYLERIDRRPT
jgi:CysZ protein